MGLFVVSLFVFFAYIVLFLLWWCVLWALKIVDFVCARPHVLLMPCSVCDKSGTYLSVSIYRKLSCRSEGVFLCVRVPGCAFEVCQGGKSHMYHVAYGIGCLIA